MNSPKVLIVDDEPFNVDYLAQELEELNFETVSAVNGRDALDKVESDAPDLILLDVMMPVMDGFEALACLKANPARRDIPVIIISANTDLRSIVKGIRLGAEDYLAKPFEPTLLHARISSSLEKKRLRDLEHLYLRSLEREMEIGHEIQKEFLPTNLPRVDGWEIAAHFKAAHQVAGDFYDAFLLPDGNLLCVVGDVCDKGVGAALFMSLFRSLIRVTATTDIDYTAREIKIRTPAERLQHVVSFTNDYMTKTHPAANMFATVFLGIFNSQEGVLTYVNCGNEPPILSRAGGDMPLLPPTGPVVGILPFARFTVKEFALENDDLILIYTDGVPDARNAEDVSYGTQPVFRILSGNRTSAACMLERIVEDLRQFIGTTNQYDDITLLAIRRVAHSD
jgi:serine phosphatase RsbU (regulator of sigma subunit)